MPAAMHAGTTRFVMMSVICGGNPLEDNFRKLHDYTLGIESIPPQTAIADSLFEFVFARLTRRRTCIHRPA